MVMEGSGWTMSSVVGLRPDSLTVLPIPLEPTTVSTVKMLESRVQELHVPREPSDFKEALPLKDVWRSAMPMSGEQCVMTSGAHLMLKWPADNLDFLQLV